MHLPPAATTEVIILYFMYYYALKATLSKYMHDDTFKYEVRMNFVPYNVCVRV